MNNKNDLLLLNDYDYIIFHYANSKKLDYKEKNFSIFRKAYFNINFFNIKYFVATSEMSNFLNLTEKDINKNFIVKRSNTLSPPMKNSRIIKLDNEEFEIREIDGLNTTNIINESKI